MDDYEWYDDDEPYLREPYVIIEKREPGVGPLSSGSRLAPVSRCCWRLRAVRRPVAKSHGGRGAPRTPRRTSSAM